MKFYNTLDELFVSKRLTKTICQNCNQEFWTKRKLFRQKKYCTEDCEKEAKKL